MDTDGTIEEQDSEQQKRQAARDDSAAGAEQAKSEGLTIAEDEPDTRVPSTGEQADGEDEEQARRRAAREESEAGQEAHAADSNVHGAHNVYEQSDVPDNAS